MMSRIITHLLSGSTLVTRIFHFQAKLKTKKIWFEPDLSVILRLTLEKCSHNSHYERETGFEPATFSLARRHSSH
jgi:hypothetical protein